MERIYLVLLLLGLLYVCRSDEVDRTREIRATGCEVVQASISLLKDSCTFPDDRMLLERICYVETRCGLDSNTFFRDGNNYHGGICQMDEIQFRGTQRGPRDLITAIRTKFNVDWTRTRWSELQRPLFSVIAAYLYIIMHKNPDGTIPRSLADQADYWATIYRPSGRKGNPQHFLDRVEEKSGACLSPRTDIVLVIDGSGSITAPNFVMMKSFAAKVVQQFPIARDAFRVGVIQYSAEAWVEIDLGTHNTKDAVVKAIDRIQYRKGGTNSAAALEAMAAMFQKKGRGDEGVPQLALFMTDGASNDPNKTTAAANKIHSETDITVFSMGVGDGFIPDEIERIGSKPACVHVSGLATFTDIAYFVDQITESACNAPSSMVPGQLNSGSIKPGQKVFLKVMAQKSKNGLTIRLNAVSGKVMLFGSWTVRTPNSAMHKYAAVVDTNSLGQTLSVPIDECPEVANGAKQCELFITLIGLDENGNGFKIEFEDGSFASAAPIIQSASSLVFSAFLLWLAW